MEKSIYKSLIISILLTSLIKIAYGIENIGVTVVSNIIVFAILLFANIKENKNENNALNEAKLNQENNFQEITKQLKNIIQKFDEEKLTKEESTQIIYKQMLLLKEKIISTNEILDKNNLNENIIELKESIINEMKSSEENVKNLYDNLFQLLNSNKNDMICNAKEGIGIISKTIEKSSENVSITLSQYLSDNINELITNLKEELRTVSQSIEENREELEKIKREMRRQVSDVVDSVNGINESINQSIECDKQILIQYENIQGSMLNEINILIEKNKNITQLIKNNYKVLNSLVTESA